MTRFDLAVVGCSSLVGESMLRLLAESEFPLGRVYAVDSGDWSGRKLEFRDRYLTVEPIEDFDFGKAQFALFAAGERLAGKYVPRAAAAGCLVVDSSARFRDSAEVPLVVAEVNPEQLPIRNGGSIVASPSPAVVALALTLKPLLQAVGIQRLDATICYPASAAGRAGVEELASQTARLLNVRDIKPRVFRGQLAFNLLPQVGELLESGASTEEERVGTEIRRLLGQALEVSITAVQVPVFYGLAASVHVRTDAALPAEKARALLRDAPGVRAVEPTDGAGYPTPVTDAARHDEVFVGRIRSAGMHSKGLNFWITADNVRKGAAINSIRLLELLVPGNG